MSSNKKTPLKLSPCENNNHMTNTPQCSIDGDIISTPIVVQSSVIDEDELAVSFSTMKVSLGGSFKRNADSFTIEGSPMISRYSKRMDVNPTPLKSDTFISDEHFSQKNNLTKLSQTSNNVVESSISKKLLVICSSSEEHNTGDHQENALRTALLCGEEGCLRRKELDGMIEWVNSDHLSAPPLCDLMRVHEYSYLQHLEEKCKSAVNKDNKLKSEKFPNFYAPSGYLDSDTPLQPQSLEAAKRFCGAAILAVDHIMNNYYKSKQQPKQYAEKRIDRAFVLGRPPGHHAGPQGCVPSDYFWRRPDMTSSGFCLLNTVAVAAGYARHKYGRINLTPTSMNQQPLTHSHIHSQSPPRIAIIDIDIHHGNGTEEIIRNLTPHSTYLPLPSSWAPISIVSYKPWLDESDAKDILFSSIHLYAEDRFYPCSGSDTPINNNSDNNKNTENSISDSNIINISLTPIGPGPWDRKARSKLTNTQRELLSKQASEEFKTKVTTRLLPKLIEFKPDLLFISAGFDAHYDDMYHFLTENDFHWITEKLCDVIDQVSGVGVISILEGGYSLSTPISKQVIRIPHKSPDTHHLEISNNIVVNTNIISDTIASNTTIGIASIANNSMNSTTIPPPSDGVISLGRGGRGKIKKEKNLIDDQVVTQSNHNASKNKSYAAVLSAPKSNTLTSTTTLASHSTTILVATNTNSITMNEHNMYAQKPGDGGLVKGVLAHTAALVGKKSWI